MSVTTAQMVTLLEYVLFETPAEAAANAPYWLGLQSTDSTVPTFAPILGASQEAQVPEQVIRFYEAALGRDPGAAELVYYTAIAENGVGAASVRSNGIAAVPVAAWNQIATDFANSPEFTADLSGQDVVTVLYQNILGRTPSSTEAAYYHQQIAAGAGNAQLLQEFVNSPEFQSRIGTNQLGTILANYGENNATGPAVFTGPVTYYEPLPQNWPQAGPWYNVAPALAEAWVGQTFLLTDTARLVVDAPTVFGASVKNATDAILALESGLAAHHVASGVYDGNTFIVESQTGTPGPTDTTIIGLVGIHAFYSPGPGTLVMTS